MTIEAPTLPNGTAPAPAAPPQPITSSDVMVPKPNAKGIRAQMASVAREIFTPAAPPPTERQAPTLAPLAPPPAAPGGSPSASAPPQPNPSPSSSTPSSDPAAAAAAASSDSGGDDAPWREFLGKAGRAGSGDLAFSAADDATGKPAPSSYTPTHEGTRSRVVEARQQYADPESAMLYLADQERAARDEVAKRTSEALVAHKLIEKIVPPFNRESWKPYIEEQVRQDLTNNRPDLIGQDDLFNKELSKLTGLVLSDQEVKYNQQRQQTLANIETSRREIEEAYGKSSKQKEEAFVARMAKFQSKVNDSLTQTFLHLNLADSQFAGKDEAAFEQAITDRDNLVIDYTTSKTPKSERVLMAMAEAVLSHPVLGKKIYSEALRKASGSNLARMKQAPAAPASGGSLPSHQFPNAPLADGSLHNQPPASNLNPNGSKKRYSIQDARTAMVQMSKDEAAKYGT